MANGLCNPRVSLILGGAASGKSLFAERLMESLIATEAGAGAKGGAIYLATARQSDSAGDAEMTAKITAHQTRRGGIWRTIEEPLDLPQRLTHQASAGSPILVDCLTLWLANLLAAGRDPDTAFKQLELVLQTITTPTTLVSNELGLGLVPMEAESRQFRNYAGELNQRVANASTRVWLVVAGCPLLVKDGVATPPLRGFTP